jgi:hypothetical protein
VLLADGFEERNTVPPGQVVCGDDAVDVAAGQRLQPLVGAPRGSDGDPLVLAFEGLAATPAESGSST